MYRSIGAAELKQRLEAGDDLPLVDLRDAEAFTRGQIGWTDSDADGIPDVVDTVPITHLDGHLGGALVCDTAVSFTGLGAVNPMPGAGGKLITVNTIGVVEYSLDQGPWGPAIPDDGMFDGPVEFYEDGSLSQTSVGGLARRVADLSTAS